MLLILKKSFFKSNKLKEIKGINQFNTNTNTNMIAKFQGYKE